MLDRLWGAAPHSPLGKSLSLLMLSNVSMPEAWEHALAKALPLMSSLHGLHLGIANASLEGHKADSQALPLAPRLLLLLLEGHKPDIQELLFAALPFCRQLAALTIKGYAVSDGPEWGASLAKVLLQCTRLHNIELSNLRLEAGGALSLAPLWEALPGCVELVKCRVVETELDAVDAAVLAPVLERCRKLKNLEVSGSGIEPHSIKMLRWAAEKAGIIFSTD